MAINIIDGFNLSSPVPIDSRFVVNNSTERTAIVYKYDGLKVFQRDNRTTYIWNSTTSIWEVQPSGNLSGSGTLNYIPRWTTGTTLGTSSLYYSGDRIGINFTNPQSLLDIKDPSGSESLGINVRRISASQDSVVIGYNWFYNLGDQRVSTSKPSTKIELGSSGSIFSIQTRTTTSSTWQPLFELNNSNGYNYFRSIDKGNFISGSVSFSSLTTPYSSNNLVFIDGSFRTNSSNHVKTTYLTYNNNTFSKQVGYTTSGSINSMINVGLSPYNISSDDHFIVVRSTTTVTSASLKLPTLSQTTSNDIGREITIQFDVQNPLNITNTMFIQSSTTIVGLDGQTTSPIVSMGDTVKFVSILENTIPKWKVIQHIKFNRVETWKFIGTGGVMDNGQLIPNFNSTSGFVISNLGSGNQTLRLRRVDEKYVNLEGTIQVSGFSEFFTESSVITLPTGYRPVLNKTYSILLRDSVNFGYKSELIIQSNGLVLIRLNNGEITSSTRYDGAAMPPGSLICNINCLFAID